jgi:hypothetical protein
MEHTIKKVTEISINIKDGFYSCRYPDNDYISGYCSVKGSEAILVNTRILSFDFLSTSIIVRNFVMEKQPDNKTFMEALGKVSDQIEKFI